MAVSDSCDLDSRPITNFTNYGTNKPTFGFLMIFNTNPKSPKIQQLSKPLVPSPQVNQE